MALHGVRTEYCDYLFEPGAGDEDGCPVLGGMPKRR
jgi:hypothetical protein